MLRNLPSVRSAYPKRDIAADKENVMSFKTPGRVGLSERSVLLKSTFKTPSERTEKVITGGGKHLPLGDNCKTPGLREITNRNAANLKGEVSKSNTRVGLRDITNHTPLAPGTVKKASEKSVERPRSRRASGKKVVTVVSPPAAVANTIATSEDVSVGVQWNDLEPEYMPPSTFEELYQPTFIFDAKALASPQLNNYVDPKIWAALCNDDPAEFVPEMTDDYKVYCEDSGDNNLGLPELKNNDLTPFMFEEHAILAV